MNKTAYLLIFIMALAVFVRFWGLDYGLPYFLVNDERPLVYGALKMGELKTLIPALHPAEFDIMNYRYNFLMSYVYLVFLVPFVSIQYLMGAFSSFGDLANHFILDPGPIWLLARAVNALIGAATVYLVYLIGRKMFSQWVGLISASFLAFSFLHVQLSHFTRPWCPMTFFAALCMLLSLYVFEKRKRKYYLWAGVAGGLAFGVSSGTFVIMAVFLLAHFLSGENKFADKLKDKNLWLALSVYAALALLFTLIHPRGLAALVLGGNVLAAEKSAVGYLQYFSVNLKTLFFYEPIVSVLSLAGLVLLWFKERRMCCFALSWPVFYISLLYFINYIDFSEDVLQVRFLILIFPWLALLAGFAAYHLTKNLKNPVKIMVVVLLLACSFATTLRYDYLLAQGDTRMAAKEWVEKNIPAGAKIISNWSGVNPTPTKKAILDQKAMDENSLRITDEALLNLDDGDYPAPAYDILRSAYIDRAKLSIGQGYRYFLAAFWEEDDLPREERSLMAEARLIKEFRQGSGEKAEDINGDFIRPVSFLFLIERPGPTIRIYELQ